MHSLGAIVSKGKVKPLKLLKKNPEFLLIFQGLRMSVEIEDGTLDELERFTYLMYGSKLDDFNSLRYKKFTERCRTPYALLGTYTQTYKYHCFNPIFRKT